MNRCMNRSMNQSHRACPNTAVCTRLIERVNCDSASRKEFVRRTSPLCVLASEAVCEAACHLVDSTLPITSMVPCCRLVTANKQCTCRNTDWLLSITSVPFIYRLVINTDLLLSIISLSLTIISLSLTIISLSLTIISLSTLK